MTKTIGNSDLIDSWAENGGVATPDAGKIDVGWLSGERPAFQYMNYLQNLYGNKLNHLLKNGIALYNATTSYDTGNLVNRNGVIYVSVADDNLNNQPPHANWATLALKNNYTATTDPTVNDDVDEGYDVGSTWINNTSGAIFVCIDNTDGAAVWTTNVTDFGEITEKTAPVLDDLAVVVDSEDADTTKIVKLRNILELIYPVGSMYINKTVSTNPGTLLGFGTWVAVEDKMIIGASGTYPAGSTGGSATTTQTTSTLANHRHSITTELDNGTDRIRHFGQTTGDRTAYTNYEGGGAAMDTISPYVAAYVWERTA